MKNDTRPLYTLINDPKAIATNGSTKKHASNLKKKILFSGIIALGLSGAAWSFSQYQTMQAKGEYLEYATAHNKPLDKALLEWGKIQYLKTHATLPERYVGADGYYHESDGYNGQFLK
jgi:hypothetical protein